MISPVYIANCNNKTNILSNNHISKQIYTTPKDTVSFSGAAKIISDAGDKAFIKIITHDLKLDKIKANKLKNLVWDFVHEHKIQSLGELGGEEHYDKQVLLHNKITKTLSLSEESSDYLSCEIIRRCEDGKDYIPQGLKGFAKIIEIEKIIAGKTKSCIANGIKRIFNDKSDDDLYKFIKKLLRQTPEQNYEFRTTVDDFLKENNIKSISDLYSSEDLIGEQAALTERLEKEFDLSENESMAINFEFLTRASTGIFSKYKPIGSVHIKDFDSVIKLVKDGNYKANGGNHFDSLLFKEMSKEAEAKGYNNIFEIFECENNPAESETMKFINNSKLSENEKIDLVLDLAKIAQDPESYADGIHKHIATDNFYARVQTDMIINKISDTFGLKGNSEDIYNDLISKQLKQHIIKLFPTYVEGGQNCTLKQIAYEIAEKYNLPSGAENKIENIINEIKSGGRKAADKYTIEKIMSELEGK